MANERILIVDDDTNICELLRLYLEKDGFQTDIVTDGIKAIEVFNSVNPELVLLDIMLPGMDGWQICREIRKTSQTPIIMLTAKGETFDKVLGLELGADDYITKPFSISELIARVDAVYRRVSRSSSRNEKQELITSGPFAIDMKSRVLVKNGNPVDLTQVEFQIMEYFLKNPNTALDRVSILHHIWGENYYGDEKIVDVNIRRIRMKIEDNPSEPEYLTTVWGYGYKWNSAG